MTAKVSKQRRKQRRTKAEAFENVHLHKNLQYREMEQKNFVCQVWHTGRESGKSAAAIRRNRYDARNGYRFHRAEACESGTQQPYCQAGGKRR